MGDKRKRTTVTFSDDTYTDLKEFADEWGISLSEVVRLAVTGNLARYLGNVQYVDSEQAKRIMQNQTAINKNIGILFNQMQDIRSELKRIGINYNQEVKLMHVRRKRAEYQKQSAEESDLVHSGNDMPNVLDYAMNTKFDAEERQILAETSRFNQDAVIKLIERFEKSASEVGDVLCRFQK